MPFPCVWVAPWNGDVAVLRDSLAVLLLTGSDDGSRRCSPT
jgi:hypothetical protein